MVSLQHGFGSREKQLNFQMIFWEVCSGDESALRDALKCLGPQLSTDFFEDSRWPVRSADLRALATARAPWPLSARAPLAHAYESFAQGWLQPQSAFWTADYYQAGPVTAAPGELGAAGVAVFGIHGSLMAEPVFALRAAGLALNASFFGMVWPSKFRCEVLMRGTACAQDHAGLDNWVDEFLGFNTRGLT